MGGFWEGWLLQLACIFVVVVVVEAFHTTHFCTKMTLYVAVVAVVDVVVVVVGDVIVEVVGVVIVEVVGVVVVEVVEVFD